MRILIIEDEETIAGNIQKYFSKSSISVDIEYTYSGGVYQAGAESYDAIIIDWMLPDGDGVKLASEIRKNQSIPILVLTAKNQTEDTIHGLNAGADDYVTKPFSLAELLARIQALIRRKNGVSLSPELSIGDISINTNKREVTLKGKILSFAPREYLLFEYLALHPDIVIDRMNLLTNVWGDDIDPLSNTIDVHIRYIRTKLGVKLGKSLIQTVKGKGYVLCTNPRHVKDCL